jgi:hypothetical protein
MTKMTRKAGLLVVPAAALALGLLAASCQKDPAAAGTGNAVAIQTSKSVVNEAPGAKFTVVAKILDQTMTPLPTAITVTSGNAAVVNVDSTVFQPELSQTIAYLRATATKADSTNVTFTGKGQTAVTKIVIVP